MPKNYYLTFLRHYQFSYQFQTLTASDWIPLGWYLPGSNLISPGWHTYGLVYRKDWDGVIGGDDSVWVDRIMFSDGEIINFENGIPQDWIFGAGWNGYPPSLSTIWYSTDDNRHYYFGADAKSVKSGNIGNNQYTYMEYSKYNDQPLDLALYYWTSTEMGDRFEFYIDRVRFFIRDGETLSATGGQTPVQTTPSYPAAYDETIAVGAQH